MPTYIVFKKNDAGAYTPFTFQTHQELGKWAIDMMSAPVAPAAAAPAAAPAFSFGGLTTRHPPDVPPRLAPSSRVTAPSIIRKLFGIKSAAEEEDNGHTQKLPTIFPERFDPLDGDGDATATEVLKMKIPFPARSSSYVAEEELLPIGEVDPQLREFDTLEDPGTKGAAATHDSFGVFCLGDLAPVDQTPFTDERFEVGKCAISVLQSPIKGLDDVEVGETSRISARSGSGSEQKKQTKGPRYWFSPSQFDLLIKFLTEEPRLFAPALFNISESDEHLFGKYAGKLNEIWDHHEFRSALGSYAKTSLDQLRGRGAGANQTLKTLIRLHNLLDEAEVDKSWNMKKPLFDGTVWTRDSCATILKRSLVAWLFGGSAPVAIKEFWLAFFVLQNYANAVNLASIASTAATALKTMSENPYFSITRREIPQAPVTVTDISSSVFLAEVQKVLPAWIAWMSPSRLSSPSSQPSSQPSFGEWLAGSITFADCKTVLGSLGIQQNRKASGKVYTGLIALKKDFEADWTETGSTYYKPLITSRIKTSDYLFDATELDAANMPSEVADPLMSMSDMKHAIEMSEATVKSWEEKKIGVVSGCNYAAMDKELCDAVEKVREKARAATAAEEAPKDASGSHVILMVPSVADATEATL